MNWIEEENISNQKEDNPVPGDTSSLHHSPKQNYKQQQTEQMKTNCNDCFLKNKRKYIRL
jgi:hypothetical protein